MRVIRLIPVILLVGCSTAAELERPEDATVIRASYVKASTILSWISGGTDTCQITVLKPAQEASETNLIDKYDVVLDSEGCAVVPSDRGAQ